MNSKTKPLLFDKDNLNEVFRDRRNKELLKKYWYSKTADLYDALIEQKANWSEYIIGLAGSGKTTFALNHMEAQKITKENLHTLLSMDFDNMIFVNAEIDDKIAQRAKRITLLHTSPDRINSNREYRDQEIKQDNAQTAFGRSAGSTSKVTTDDSILVSRLKTDYENKSRIIAYKSNDNQNRDNTQEIQVKTWIKEEKKYVEGGVVTASWKRSPPQIVHIEEQLKKVLSLAKEKNLTPYAFMTMNSWWEYDLGLTQNERIKIANLVLKWELPFFTTTQAKFIKNKKWKVIKVIPNKSIAVIWKERLPDWFEKGSYQDLLDNYPEFFKNYQDAYAVRAFEDYNFINMWDIQMEWTQESVSATFVRKNIVEWNIEAIKPYLSPEIFELLTSPENIKALQSRYQLIQKRDDELKEKKSELDKKYKHTNPITWEPVWLNRNWNQIIINKTFANKYWALGSEKKTDRRSYAKIMTYIKKVDQIIKSENNKIKKKYKNEIYSQNKLVF